MSIKENINKIKETLPNGVKLVAVSKTKPDEMVHEAIDAGHFVFGENKVQAMINRIEGNFPDTVEWHFIGHLQSNKVKYIAPFISLVHAVDKFKLLKTIDKEAKKNDRVIDCLLQFHIADEESKFGFSYDSACKMLDDSAINELKNIRICGVMGMATFTDDELKVRNEFKRLKTIFDHLKTNYFQDQSHFKELSMGMSGDYMIAIEEGSTIVRIGSTIFGPR